MTSNKNFIVKNANQKILIKRSSVSRKKLTTKRLKRPTIDLLKRSPQINFKRIHKTKS